MNTDNQRGKGPPPVRRSGPGSSGPPNPMGPVSGGPGSSPFDDDRTVTVGRNEPAPVAIGPNGQTAAPSFSEQPSSSRSKKRMGLIAAGVLGLGAVGFGAYTFLGDGFNGGSERQVLFSRGSDFDLYAAAPGQELTRDDRIGRDTGGLGTFRSWNGTSVDFSQQLEIGGRTLGIVLGSESSSIVDLDDGTEIFEGSFFSRVITDGDELFIRESRDGGDRCYQGPIDQIERVSRGGECSFSLLGHLLTSDDDGDETEINVTSADGAQLLNGPIIGSGTLSDDGIWLIDVATDTDRTRVLNVITGTEVYDESGTIGWQSGPDGLLMLRELNDDFETTVRVLDQTGSDAVVASNEDSVQTGFLESGDIVVATFDDDRVSVLRWSLATSEGTELIDSDHSINVVRVDNDIIIGEADDLGYLLTRYAADGSETLLWEYEGDDMPGGTLRLDDAEDVLMLQSSSSNNGNVVALIPLDGSEPAFSDEWDGSRFLDARDGTFLVRVDDGSSSIALALRSGDEPVELLEAPNITAGLVSDNTVLVTVSDDGDRDTIAVDDSTGEPIGDLDYSGYSLAEDTDWFFQSWLF